MRIDDETRQGAGGVHVFEAAQHDDDDVLDVWLASLSPTTFALVLDGLVSRQDGLLSRLWPTT